jgi:G6PDH family F420-dependent oxidoreductase
MARFGYKLMSEEHGPSALVENASRAEDAGFDFVAISDHFHPWLRSQGHSPYAWSVLGAIAARTTRVGLVTAVTCPTVRYHPAIVAQAAATLACLSDGRLTLGLGAGEALNEHVVGRRWPPPRDRRAMLGEAVEVLRLLWQGGMRSYRGRWFSVDRAELFDRPERPPPIAVAAGGPATARFAAKRGDGLFATAPDRKLVDAWRAAGGRGPAYAEVALSWAREESEAVRVAHERFRFGLLGWKVMPELANPENFEAATRWIDADDVRKAIPCGPDVERHVAAIRRYCDAGFDHVVLVGVGPDKAGFVRFWQRELAPALSASRAATVR